MRFLLSATRARISSSASSSALLGSGSSAVRFAISRQSGVTSAFDMMSTSGGMFNKICDAKPSVFNQVFPVFLVSSGVAAVSRKRFAPEMGTVLLLPPPTCPSMRRGAAWTPRVP